MVARGVAVSEERKQAMAEGRAAARERARIVGFPVKCKVRVETPREPRYHGRVGTVSEHNEGEIGVRFVQSDPAVWFLPGQLVRLATEKRSQNGG
jgi:hypothetical protein